MDTVSWSRLAAMLCHPRPDHRERVFVMLRFLEAYMDDSGSHDQAKVSVIAGYFGGHNRWIEFEEKWKSVLNEFSVREFHAKRFWQRDEHGRRLDEYRDWSDVVADTFINQLLGIIESSKNIYPFAAGVHNEEFWKEPIDKRRLYTGASNQNPTGKPSKSMFMAFQRCVMNVAGYCNPGIQVHYFFDDDRTNTAWANICYSQLKKISAETDGTIHDSMGSITLADSVDAVPLQAADLLAYEARRYGEQLIKSNLKNIEMGDVYRRAVSNRRSRQDFWFFDEARFESLHRLLEQ